MKIIEFNLKDSESKQNNMKKNIELLRNHINELQQNNGLENNNSFNSTFEQLEIIEAENIKLSIYKEMNESKIKRLKSIIKNPEQMKLVEEIQAKENEIEDLNNELDIMKEENKIIKGSLNEDSTELLNKYKETIRMYNILKRCNSGLEAEIAIVQNENKILKQHIESDDKNESFTRVVQQLREKQIVLEKMINESDKTVTFNNVQMPHNSKIAQSQSAGIVHNQNINSDEVLSNLITNLLPNDKNTDIIQKVNKIQSLFKVSIKRIKTQERQIKDLQELTESAADIITSYYNEVSEEKKKFVITDPKSIEDISEALRSLMNKENSNPGNDKKLLKIAKASIQRAKEYEQKYIELKYNIGRILNLDLNEIENGNLIMSRIVESVNVQPNFALYDNIIQKVLKQADIFEQKVLHFKNKYCRLLQRINDEREYFKELESVFAYSLKIIFPANCGLNAHSSKVEIEKRLKKLRAIMKSLFNLIPEQEIPNKTSIYVLALELRRILGSSCIEDFSFDLSADFSISDLEMYQNTKVGLLYQYEERIQELLEMLHNSISYDRLESILCEILRLEANEACEDDIECLFEAIKTKIDEVNSIQAKFKAYKEITTALLQGIGNKVPSNVAHLVEQLKNATL